MTSLMRGLFLLGGLFVAVGRLYAADITFLQQNSQPKYLVTASGIGGLCGEIYLSLQKKLQKQNVISSVYSHPLPIKRIFSLVETSPGHVFCGATWTKARSHRFRYSKIPLYKVSNVLIARKDDLFNPLGFDDLIAAGDAVGALYGISSTRFLRQNIGSLVNDSFNDLEAAIKLIGMPPHRLRYLFYHDLGLNYLVKHSPYSLRVIPTKFRSFEQWFIYNPETPKYIVDIMETELTKMRESGELQLILDKYFD